MPASEITGPWRVLRTTMLTSLWPFTRMVSLALSKTAQPSGVRYILASSGLTCSMKMSCTSGPVFVKPQATCSFWPSTTPGMPGIDAPAIFTPGISRRTKYHSAGALSLRCGSLASSGLPVVVWLPATTQLFEPTPSTPDSGACKGRLNHDVCVRADRFRLRYSAA